MGHGSVDECGGWVCVYRLAGFTFAEFSAEITIGVDEIVGRGGGTGCGFNAGVTHDEV